MTDKFLVAARKQLCSQAERIISATCPSKVGVLGSRTCILKLVLNRIDANGYAIVTGTQLTELSQYSYTTVLNVLKTLVEAGILTSELYTEQDYPRPHNRYRLGPVFCEHELQRLERKPWGTLPLWQKYRQWLLDNPRHPGVQTDLVQGAGHG